MKKYSESSVGIALVSFAWRRSWLVESHLGMASLSGELQKLMVVESLVSLHIISVGLNESLKKLVFVRNVSIRCNSRLNTRILPKGSSKIDGQ